MSVYVANICEKEIFEKEDPQAVVIDEVLGYLTTLFLINPVGVKIQYDCYRTCICNF